MESQTLQPLKQTGNVSENWTTWKQKFEIYSTTIELANRHNLSMPQFIRDIRNQSTQCEFRIENDLTNNAVMAMLTIGINDYPIREKLLQIG
ncbi:hypothetical protein ILUMI_25165 [Ignelater luminosus]|uniref:Uncharacterized protein n=1 Tax=Ignelater luminosus TaxID=2038154 RepID=A0A8K0CB32_IGNLU|nr:hypothetical protein ILUMI_25165 [Ignelater luminosus]